LISVHKICVSRLNVKTLENGNFQHKYEYLKKNVFENFLRIE